VSTEDPGPESISAPGLVHDLERTLGLGVIVLSIEDAPEFRIRALLMLGQHSQEVSGVGATEAEAWQDLAKAAVAWRTSDDKHIPMWWGGGG
jgi:hypothetical protein